MISTCTTARPCAIASPIAPPWIGAAVTTNGRRTVAAVGVAPVNVGLAFANSLDAKSVEGSTNAEPYDSTENADSVDTLDASYLTRHRVEGTNARVRGSPPSRPSFCPR